MAFGSQFSTRFDLKDMHSARECVPSVQFIFREIPQAAS